MPALTTLSVVDGASTPNTLDFAPIGKPNGVATFKNGDGVPVGDNHLTVSSTHGNREKVSLRLKLPVTNQPVVNGVASEVVGRTAYVRMDFDFASDSTMQERLDAISIARSVLSPNQGEIRAVIVDLHDFY